MARSLGKSKSAKSFVRQGVKGPVWRPMRFTKPGARLARRWTTTSDVTNCFQAASPGYGSRGGRRDVTPLDGRFVSIVSRLGLDTLYLIVSTGAHLYLESTTYHHYYTILHVDLDEHQCSSYMQRAKTCVLLRLLPSLKSTSSSEPPLSVSLSHRSMSAKLAARRGHGRGWGLPLEACGGPNHVAWGLEKGGTRLCI